MNKPDWKDAPEWANYLAMDDSGGWFWYENEPVKFQFKNWDVSIGNVEWASEPDKISWEASLESRPE